MSELENLLRSHNPAGPSHPKYRAGWVNIDCPFCPAGMGKKHLGIHLSRGYGNCWKCGGHDLVSIIRVLKPSWSKGEVRSLVVESKRLAGLWGATHKVTGTKLVRPKYRGPLAAPHRQYLKRRGFNSKQLAQLWGLQGIGHAPRLAWRIYIPVRLPDGTEVAWTTRSLKDDDKRKYITSSLEESRVSVNDILYGEEFATDTVIVHEGPADVWATGPGSVAVLGVNYSDSQVARLARFRKRYICFDPEPDAQRRAAKLCQDLAAFDGETHNIELETGDPAECSSAERRELQRLLI